MGTLQPEKSKKRAPVGSGMDSFPRMSVVSLGSLGIPLSQGNILPKPVIKCSGPESVLSKFTAQLCHKLCDHEQITNFSVPQFPPFSDRIIVLSLRILL